MDQHLVLTNRRDGRFGIDKVVEAARASDNPLLCRLRSHCCYLLYTSTNVQMYLYYRSLVSSLFDLLMTVQVSASVTVNLPHINTSDLTMTATEISGFAEIRSASRAMSRILEHCSVLEKLEPWMPRQGETNTGVSIRHPQA